MIEFTDWPTCLHCTQVLMCQITVALHEYIAVQIVMAQTPFAHQQAKAPEGCVSWSVSAARIGCLYTEYVLECAAHDRPFPRLWKIGRCILHNVPCKGTEKNFLKSSPKGFLACRCMTRHRPEGASSRHIAPKVHT